jgi:hypothetical protein
MLARNKCSTWNTTSKSAAGNVLYLRLIATQGLLHRGGKVIVAETLEDAAVRRYNSW